MENKHVKVLRIRDMECGSNIVQENLVSKNNALDEDINFILADSTAGSTREPWWKRDILFRTENWKVFRMGTVPI